MGRAIILHALNRANARLPVGGARLKPSLNLSADFSAGDLRISANDRRARSWDGGNFGSITAKPDLFTFFRFHRLG
jgi:hypothetical protein